MDAQPRGRVCASFERSTRQGRLQEVSSHEIDRMFRIIPRGYGGIARRAGILACSRRGVSPDGGDDSERNCWAKIDGIVVNNADGDGPPFIAQHLRSRSSPPPGETPRREQARRPLYKAVSITKGGAKSRSRPHVPHHSRGYGGIARRAGILPAPGAASRPTGGAKVNVTDGKNDGSVVSGHGAP